MDIEGLSFICAGLGYAQEDDNGAITGYTKNEYCLDNLKDIQRFLRRDDPQKRDVFKQICKFGTVTKDLVPIIEHYQSDRNLAMNVVKILVFLTMPIDSASFDIVQQMEYLWDLKTALTRNVTVAVVVSLLEDPLGHLEGDEFGEEDWKVVQLVLTLFRNILAIQEITLQQKASGLATQFLFLSDRFLELMFQENVMDLILVLTNCIDSSSYLREDNLLLLEIYHYIFLGRDPESIAKAPNKSIKADEYIKTSVDSLKAMMEEEEEKRKKIRQRNLERHSQFSGTFTRFTVDGSKELFKRNPNSFSGNGPMKVHKIERGPVKRIAWDHGALVSTKEDLLDSLCSFLNQFLSGGYNVLMQTVIDAIRKEHQAIQKNDVVLFFRVVHFVLAFQHQKVQLSRKLEIKDPISGALEEDGHADNLSVKTNICGPVAATVSDTMFTLVISKWLESFEGLKETNDHKPLLAAGSLMKSMIRMLDLVLKFLPEDSKEAQTARVLLYKLFYDQTDQGFTQFLFNLFKSFDSFKQPKSYLADLMETIHILFRLMEKLQTRGTLRVARKARKARKKNLKGAENSENSIVTEKNKGLDGSDQTNEATKHDSEILSESKVEEKTNSDLVEKESFSLEGTSISKPAAESSLNVNSAEHLGDNALFMDSNKASAVPTNLAHETTDSSSDDQLPEKDEVDFNITRLVARFATAEVLRNLCWLLKYYKSNSISTNHYIICMLQRFCDDLEISPMLYQLSILIIFYEILADQKSSSSKEYAGIISFITRLIRKMLKLMKQRPMLFVEILSWKTRRECHIIDAEDLLGDLDNLKKDGQDQGSGSDPPDRRPLHKSIAESLGDDEGDFEVMPLGTNNKREGNILDDFNDAEDFSEELDIPESEGDILDLKNDNNNSESKGKFESSGASKKRKGYIFNQDQEIAIKNLYEKYKNDRKCSRLIAEALDPDGNLSAIQVNRKLKQLGLRITAKKKLGDASAPQSTGDVSASNLDPSTSREQQDGSLTKALPSKRKRSRVFSKDQVIELRNLFKIFKNHKRTSHMIAKALVPSDQFTAEQVSRKLKALGLLESDSSWNSETRKLNRDNESEGMEDSDEEVLLSIHKRAKKKIVMEDELGAVPEHRVATVEDIDNSEDDTLLSILQSRKRRMKSSVDVNMKSMPKDEDSALGSDNEVLSSKFKTKKRAARMENKHEPNPTMTTVEDNANSEDDVLLSTLQRQRKPKLLVDVPAENVSRDEGSNNEALSSIFKKHNSPPELNQPAGDVNKLIGIDALDDDIEDDLENSSHTVKNGVSDMDLVDSGDDMDVAPKKLGSKRNLKLIIDDDEDD